MSDKVDISGLVLEIEAAVESLGNCLLTKAKAELSERQARVHLDMAIAKLESVARASLKSGGK